MVVCLMEVLALARMTCIQSQYWIRQKATTVPDIDLNGFVDELRGERGDHRESCNYVFS